MKDKIIFWINSDFIQLGLAKSLKSIHDSDIFCVVDATDRLKIFFKDQNFVHFNKSWFYHDHIKKQTNDPDMEFLLSFEKKYKINLWLLVQNERIFTDYNSFYNFKKEEIFSILEQECKFFEKILNEVQPDFLITYMTNLHHNHLFYLMCKAKGIKVLMLIPTRLSNRYMISNEPEKFDQYHISTNSFESKTPEQLLDFLNKKSAIKDSEKISTTFLTSKLSLLNAAIQFFIHSKNSNLKTHYTYYGRTKIKVLVYTIFYLLKKKYRTYYINKFLSKDISDKNFIFFPLQTEPERSLLIGAPFNTDQLNTIKQIAKSIPINYMLYVKEHPVQIVREWRKISFYKELLKLPNVKIIHPSVSSKNLLKTTSLVITAGGTVGFEAAFYGKPTLSFVNSLYSELKSIYPITNMNKLPELIIFTLDQKMDYDDLQRYLVKLEKNSFEIDMMDLEVFINEHFFYGGFLVDVDIPNEKMKIFFEKFENIFNTLAIEYMNKINQYNNPIS